MLLNRQVKLPLWWIVDTHGEDRGAFYVSAMMAPGLGRIGLRPYLRKKVPLSEMAFDAESHPEDLVDKGLPLKEDRILGMHSFALGNETLTCRDVINYSPFFPPFPGDPSIAKIECLTERSDFFASFTGWRGDLPAFYATIRGITVN